MKTKDIVILVVATAVIIGSVIFTLQILAPAKTGTQQVSEADKIKTVPKSSEIDQATLKKLETLSDHGRPALDGVGKSDLFSAGAGSYVTPVPTPTPTQPQTNTNPTEDAANEALTQP